MVDELRDPFCDAQARELVIPDKVREEAVVGRGGSNISSFMESNGFRCAVDADSRKVTLTGDEAGVKGVEDDLAKLFTKFDIAEPGQKRDYRATAADDSSQRRSQPGRCALRVVHPSSTWVFERERVRSSDVNVRNHLYRLARVESEASTAVDGGGKSWISVYREPGADMTSETSPKRPISIKVAFGKLCFKPLSQKFPEAKVAWQELQELTLYKDFEVRWTNVCVRAALPDGSKLCQLEKQMKNGGEPYKTLLVYVADRRRQGYEVKYHFVDGQWKLRNIRCRREVCSRFDVFVDNETSFRLRGATHGEVPDKVAESLERHIVIAAPSKIAFFAPEVTVSRSAPFVLRWAEPKLKVHLEAKGLRFTVSYLDRRQKEFRLECRLPAAEKKELATPEERRVLLKKVLEMLRDESA